jgi:hypothetical protein
MKRKLLLAGVLIAACATTLKLANILFAPAIGAATVQQMDASNASYFASMSLAGGAPMAIVIIAGLFGIALYLVTRSEE